MKKGTSENGRLRRTRNILASRIGRKNAITSRSLASELGISEGDTRSVTRRIIDRTIRRYRLPVAANTNAGYFFITSEGELLEYMRSLDGRMMEIKNKKELVYRNFREYYGPI